MKIQGIVFRLFVMFFILHAGHVLAQDTRPLGTIDEIMQDDGYIVIDAQRFEFKASNVSISWQGRPMRTSFLASGLRIRYTTHADGSISNIELVGPASVLEQLDNQ